MDWLLVAILGIIWIALLVPTPTGRKARATPGDYSVFTEPGRRVLMPQRGERFLGQRDREVARARVRRLRVFTVLLEGIGLTALIGLFPPFRKIWMVTLLLVIALGVYVWFLLQLKMQQAGEIQRAAAETIEQAEQILAPEPDYRVVAGADRPVVVILTDQEVARRDRAAG